MTLEVLTSNAAPKADLSTSGLVFLARQGDPPPSPQVLQIRNAGGGTLTYNLQASTLSGGAWLALTSTSGSLTTVAGAIPVSVNPTALSPGLYRGKITATFSTGGPQEVEVLLVVSPAGTTTPQRGQLVAATCSPTSMDMVGTTIGNGINLAVSYPNALLAQLADNCGENVDVATMTASIEGLVITMQSVGGGIYSGTWTPTRSASAVGMVLAATHPTLSVVQRNYTVSTSAAAGGVALPVLAPNGVVEGAGFTPLRPLVPGSIISIFGSRLGTGETFARQMPLERSLGGTSVRIGNENAPLYYVGPEQINAQVPLTAKVGESVSVVVNAGGRITAPQNYLIAPVQPGIFNGAVLDFQNDPAHGGAPVTASNPARIGHDLIIYASGLGLTDANPPVATGAASPTARALLPVTVTIGGIPVPVDYAGLTPDYVGLYQVNVRLTSAVPTGDNIPVVLTQNGITSNANLPIRISIR